MEVDTGVTVSIVSETAFQRKYPQRELNPTPLVLSTYTGEAMKVIGTFTAKVRYQKQEVPDLE